MPTFKRPIRQYFPPAATVVVLFVLVALAIQCVRNGGVLGRNEKVRSHQMTCVNNLKQIGLALHQWSLDNDDRFPFNVSTNAWGTLEMCARGQDGFDGNAAFHFQVLSNELVTPTPLVCPKDRSRKSAVDFSVLQPENISYRLRSGTNLSMANPKAVLAICPVDGNTLYCDGSVEERKAGDRR